MKRSRRSGEISVKVELRVEARRDVLKTALWHNERETGTAETYLQSVEEDLLDLERGQAGVHVQVHGFHRKLTRRYS